MTQQTPPSDSEPEAPALPDYPLPVARLARALGTGRSTLGRALEADPDAPDPDDHDDKERPLYRYEPVAEWWPRRRGRGRPRTISDARDGLLQQPRRAEDSP